MIFKLKFLLIILILLFGFSLFFIGYQNIIYEIKTEKNFSKTIDFNKNLEIKKEIILKKNKKEVIENVKITQLKEFIVEVKKNQNFLSIINQYISSNEIIFEIINQIEKIYDLKKLQIGEKIYFYQNLNNQKFEKIKIPIKNNINLIVFISDKIKTEKKFLKTTLEPQSKEYLISNSLYNDGIKNNIPIEILTKLIRLYSFDLDFQRDIKKNTKVSISYDSIIIEDRHNKYFGDIHYALIEIEKNKLEYFKFKTDDGFTDYFNRKGENVKKSILKTPLDGAKLSSGFGMRKHPILGFNKMHKGIDFAAPKNTPIFAGGNGVIEYAGKNGGYGNYIKIRHNNQYKTAYAHLSSFKKGIRKGFRVNQGDIIGYVGSTGNSTGPHLHYEIIYQNKQINPLTLKLPSGKILLGKELNRFISEMKLIYANHLNLLFE